MTLEFSTTLLFPIRLFKHRLTYKTAKSKDGLHWELEATSAFENRGPTDSRRVVDEGSLEAPGSGLLLFRAVIFRSSSF
ncbi:Protein of unknown function [Pyronema omphalodes CBS 100304]|uniref:Uncharacterized protein n=1 Tax=Pyronema omphalodes (strain CBS 100304) TaxID=1076935 RepID=U4LI42_PYROM|nr:Protein of unknown function [Pyronema omphalodes CBS 100304]